MLKTIIFDFDGVIGDTYKINLDLSRSFDSTMTEQDFKDHHNGNVFEKPKIKFREKDIPVFFAKQKQTFAKENIFPLKRVLEELNNKFKLFVISSTIDENIDHFLKLGDLSQFFERILGATTHRSKIEKFKMIFRDFGYSPEECLFVTDTIGDIIEAREVGVRTIAVSWGYHEVDELQRENPIAVVNDEIELLEIINSLSE